MPAEPVFSDCMTFPEVEISNLGENQDNAGKTVVASQDVAHYASDRLHAVLQGIFNTEDLPFTDASSVDVHTLAADKIVKLDVSLQQLIAADRLGDIPSDDLHRLQKLCMGNLTTLQSSELLIDATWCSDEVLAWLQRVGLADCALRSAGIIGKIFLGLNGEEGVCSEETLQSIVGVLDQIFNACIIPIVEARPKYSGAERFERIIPFRNVIGQLLYQANRVMELLVKILAKLEINEKVIIALSFFAARILFVDNAQLEKESVLGIQKFEAPRRSAMDIITVIFAKHPQQRSFIFDEILSSMHRLPTKGKGFRQFKLEDGTSIQLVSALIMRLIQTSSAPASRSSKKTRRGFATQRMRSLSKSKTSDPKGEESSGAVTDSDASQALSMGSDGDTHEGEGHSLLELANELSSNAAKDARYVVGYIVRRAMTASKTGDQPYRHFLDIFVEDLTLVLSNAEWPASELLLSVLMSIMMNICEKKSTAPAKTMALELLSTMGSSISEFVASTQSLAGSLENKNSARGKYLRQMLDDYTDGRSQSSELFVWEGPYHIVLDYLASTTYRL
ncbi:MAG: hypothetical protein Q9178_007336 [Gyalolechia marmorata]